MATKPVTMKIVVASEKNAYETIIVDTTQAKVDKLLPLLEAISKFKPYENAGCNFENNYPRGVSICTAAGELPPNKLYTHIKAELFELMEQLLDSVPNTYCIHYIHISPRVKWARLL